MNLLLLTPNELENGIPRTDSRAHHIETVLRKESGDSIRVGILEDHLLGEVKIQRNPSGEFQFITLGELKKDKDSRVPLQILIGAVRPPTTQRLLRDLCTIGAREIVFFPSKLSEKSYLVSKVLKEEAIRETILLGASQAKTTYLPQIRLLPNLHQALRLPKEEAHRIFLDQEGQEVPRIGKAPVSLLLGPERGFTDEERQKIIRSGFFPLSLGPRILRTETAATAASLLISQFLPELS